MSILKNITFSSLLAISIQGAHSSALVERDPENRTLTVTARFVYSGPALTEEIAEAATREIDEMWNEVPTEVSLLDGPYRVIFDVDYVMGSTLTVLNNLYSCAYNFIQVHDKSHRDDRSFYTGLGSRFGVFFTSDGLGTSTTAAHEYGHGLMLEHNHGDQRRAEVPGIMFARGTFVRPEYQWNPEAMLGQPGSTLNPKFRKVRSEDIQAIPFDNTMSVIAPKLYCLGDGQALKIK